MLDILDDVTTRKRRAQRLREAGQFDSARDILRETILQVADLIPSSALKTGPPTAREKRAAEALAELYGSLGGVLRSKTAEARRKDPAAPRRYEDALKAYDDGFVYESDQRYGIVNSYNLTQRLVIRLLLQPERWGGEEWHVDADPQQLIFPKEFAVAAGLVERQLAGPRAGDPWAIADLALLRTLDPHADGVIEWVGLVNTKPSPPGFVYTSTLRALQDLAWELQGVDQASEVREKLVHAQTLLDARAR